MFLVQNNQVSFAIAKARVAPLKSMTLMHGSTGGYSFNTLCSEGNPL